MQRSTQGRGLFYTRDSEGKHETTPGEYVAWAQRRSDELGVSFQGTPAEIQAMIRDGRSASGDLFLDYGVQGHILSRPGWDALVKEAASDFSVSHVFIPRRNRVARPDDPLDGMQMENALRSRGVTVVFMDRTLMPLKKKARRDIGEQITALIDYDRSGEDRRELAQKIILAQIHLAKSGFSSGGRAPYGFRRWLAKEDGTPVRALADKEHVRMPGHHVVWVPGPEEEWVIIRRILMMLKTTPASRVAAQLTAEGVPAPDSGRHRTDNGIRHATSGVWHQTTIVNIARNPLLLALVTHGRRSMGDRLRFTPKGPRELEADDFRRDENPKVIQNPESSLIVSQARFQPPVNAEQHHQLLATLDARAGTQKGKPRARDPNRNPLGGRVFDMNCGWLMYRIPYNSSFRYGCGHYQQSHGAECNHNHVDGPTATRFMLSCLRQRLISPTMLPRLERNFRELAAKAQGNQNKDRKIAELRTQLADLQVELKTISANMARVKTDAQFNAISAIFEEATLREASLNAQIAEEEARTRHVADAETEVAKALDIVHRLTELVSGADRLDIAGQAFKLVNAQLFLRFQKVQVKNRTLNKVAGGAVTFGAAPPPIEIYCGPTGRRALHHNGSTAPLTAEPGKPSLPAPPQSSVYSGSEGKSLRNVSRGERI